MIKQYSTTKLLITEKPQITNKSEDKFDSLLFLPKNKDRQYEGGLRTKGFFKKSYDNKPLIAIITVVFNGEEFLEETILSVINQTYDNVEYIIIDGGSTDGTIDIIKKYDDMIDYWVSEKDSGIYDAMNKGIALAVGEIIGIINADDFYADNTISVICKNYKVYNYSDILYGKIYLLFDDRKELRIPSKINLYKSMSLNHPTCFFKKSAYKERVFDVDLKLQGTMTLCFIVKLKTKHSSILMKLLHL